MLMVVWGASEPVSPCCPAVPPVSLGEVLDVSIRISVVLATNDPTKTKDESTK